MVLSLTCDSVHLIAAYYSFYLPQKDERLSWLRTYSKQFTHISGHPSAVGQAQIRESSLVKDRRSTTVPRSQLQNPNGQTNWCKKLVSPCLHSPILLLKNMLTNWWVLPDVKWRWSSANGKQQKHLRYFQLQNCHPAVEYPDDERHKINYRSKT